MGQQTLFGFPVALPEGWLDQSVYTFVKPAGANGEAGAAGGGPVTLQAAGAGTPAAQRFQPNVVAIRERQAGRDLGAFAQEQRRRMQEKLPAAKLVREGQVQIGALRGHEQEYQIALERPLPALVQWHVTLPRDGYFYHFCCSSSQAEFARDKAEFQALLGSWAG
ncbi:MAG: hypothetical protein KatS3mg102_1415 [Planctomycetota bacterium]|nr:MAG: hypothetical protein KatS3mg102_1415 [Planctomycetota bacterium]